MSTFSDLFSGGVLPSETQHILRSTTWTAPANGYVRVVAASGGGGGVFNVGAGGASELRGWQWKAVTAGQQITFTIGAGGGPGAEGGTTTVTAPWGSVTPAAGGMGSPANNGGTGGTGGDFAYPGGSGGVGSYGGGGALNPFNQLPADVSGSAGATATNACGGGVLSAATSNAPGVGQAPSGWMSFICGGGGEKKPGSGGTYTPASAAPGGLGGGAANDGGATGGAGFALLEFVRKV